jgi:hypothetical protein
MRHKKKSFFQTPKGLVTIILVILVVMAAPGQGIRAVAAGLVSATIAAGMADAVILRGPGAVVRHHHHLGDRGSQ